MPDAGVSTTVTWCCSGQSGCNLPCTQKVADVFPGGMRLESGRGDRLTSALQPLLGGKSCNPDEVALTELQSQATRNTGNRLTA